jgi:hypothetical protein
LINEALSKLKNDLNSGFWGKRFGDNISKLKSYDGGYRIVSFEKK